MHGYIRPEEDNHTANRITDIVMIPVEEEAYGRIPYHIPQILLSGVVPAREYFELAPFIPGFLF